MIVERGQQDYKSELQRFPRLFQAAETIPGLTWPTLTFGDRLSLWLGKLQVDIIHAGRGHTKGDTIVWLPEERTLFSGDLVEYGATPYCGDAHYKDWPETLQKLRDLKAEALVPGRGDALMGEHAVEEGIAGTQQFLSELYKAVSASVESGEFAEAGLRQGDGHAAAALRQLGDLRALHAVRRQPRLRRGQGPRPSAHLDRRARHRDVVGAGKSMIFAGTAPLRGTHEHERHGVARSQR